MRHSHIAITPEEQQDKEVRSHPALKQLMTSTPAQIEVFVDNKIASGQQAYLLKLIFVVLSFVLRKIKD